MVEGRIQPYTFPRSHPKEQEKKKFNYQCSINLYKSDAYDQIIQTLFINEAEMQNFQDAEVV